MEQREKDIQQLCKDVIENCYPNEHYNTGECTCPFCGGAGWETEMSKLKHEGNCAYLIAKDLSVGV